MWADTAYRSKRSEVHPEKNGFVSKSTAGSPRASPCPRPCARPTSPHARSAPKLHTSSATRNTAQTYACAPSPVPPPRPALRIRFTTCRDSCGSKPEVRTHHRKSQGEGRSSRASRRACRRIRRTPVPPPRPALHAHPGEARSAHASPKITGRRSFKSRKSLSQDFAKVRVGKRSLRSPPGQPAITQSRQESRRPPSSRTTLQRQS